MTHPTSPPHAPPNAIDTAQRIREAMGPGYQMALFREQASITGTPLPSPVPVAPRVLARPRRRPRRLRLPLPRLVIGFGRLIGLRLA